MRSFKKLYVIAGLLLCFGLSCSELPETFRLSDDPSNDFVEDSAVSRTADVESAPGIQDLAYAWPASALTPDLSLFPVPVIVHSAELTSASGTDLLRLFSIQRT